MDSLQIAEQVSNCNKQALNYLRVRNVQAALSHLSTAKTLLRGQEGSQLHVLTYNNLACVYKQDSDFYRAQKYLQKAVQINTRIGGEVSEVASTLLNLSAIKGKLNMHREALEHSLKALSILKQTFDASHNNVTALIVAFHSSGLEYEALADHGNALDCFRNAMELALEQLGRSHPLTKLLKEAHCAAINKQKDSPKKSNSLNITQVLNQPSKSDLFAQLPVIKEHRPKSILNIINDNARSFDSISKKYRKKKRVVGQTVQTRFDRTVKEKLGSLEERIESLQRKVSQFHGNFKTKRVSFRRIQMVKMRTALKALKVWVFIKKRAAKVICRGLSKLFRNRVLHSKKDSAIQTNELTRHDMQELLGSNKLMVIQTIQDVYDFSNTSPQNKEANCENSLEKHIPQQVNITEVVQDCSEKGKISDEIEAQAQEMLDRETIKEDISEENFERTEEMAKEDFSAQVPDIRNPEKFSTIHGSIIMIQKWIRGFLVRRFKPNQSC